MFHLALVAVELGQDRALQIAQSLAHFAHAGGAIVAQRAFGISGRIRLQMTKDDCCSYSSCWGGKSSCGCVGLYDKTAERGTRSAAMTPTCGLDRHAYIHSTAAVEFLFSCNARPALVLPHRECTSKIMIDRGVFFSAPRQPAVFVVSSENC